MTTVSEKTLEHIGYIMDGNRRWAKSHGIPSYEGHLAGYNALKDVLTATLDSGIRYASIYAFSDENWKRSAEEVKKIMGLFVHALRDDIKFIQDRNVKVLIIGSRDNLPDKITEAIEDTEHMTARNTAGTLAICFNYGGQREIVDAVKKIVQSGVDTDDITPDLVSQNIYAPEIPPCDLIVRTSGEKRLSNFMLWRSAYSELMFIDKNWPDMTAEDVSAIIEEYKRRNRRFGG